jgi:hypothetical protein
VPSDGGSGNRGRPVRGASSRSSTLAQNVARKGASRVASRCRRRRRSLEYTKRASTEHLASSSLARAPGSGTLETVLLSESHSWEGVSGSAGHCALFVLWPLARFAYHLLLGTKKTKIISRPGHGSALLLSNLRRFWRWFELRCLGHSH